MAACRFGDHPPTARGVCSKCGAVTAVDLRVALAESLGIAPEDLPPVRRTWSDVDGEPADDVDPLGREADLASRRQYGP